MAICFICLEACVPSQYRATVTLVCGHLFHLACIGCEFNVKGAMECPVCRKREISEWKFCWGDPGRPRLGMSDVSNAGDDEVSEELSVSGCSVEGCDCTGSLGRRQSHYQPQQQEQDLDSESEFESEPDSEQEVQIFRPVTWLRPLTSGETWRLLSAINTAEGSSSSLAPPPLMIRTPFWRPEISLSVLINPVPRNFPRLAEAMGRNASAGEKKGGEEEL